MKGIQIGKEDIKLSLLIDYTTVYAEIQNNQAKILLELISDYKKIVKYLNVQTSVIIIYTKYDQGEFS